MHSTLGGRMKKGLIIQGPLLSRGRTGRTINIGFSKVTETDVVDYDCVANIANIYNEFKDIYDHIICVTWNTEDRSKLKDVITILGEESVLILDDKTKKINSRGPIISDNNKYRQFFSTQKGLDLLSQLGCELAVKVRTDQFSNYDCLLDVALESIKHNKVVVPWMNTSNILEADELPDLYFAGEVSLLNKLCSHYLESKEVDRLVHKDLFYCWSSYLGTKTLVPLKLMKKIKINLFKFNYVTNSWINNFTPGPETILKNMTWRGERVTNFAEDKLFLNNLESKEDFKQIILNKFKR